MYYYKTLHPRIKIGRLNGTHSILPNVFVYIFEGILIILLLIVYFFIFRPQPERAGQGVSDCGLGGQSVPTATSAPSSVCLWGRTHNVHHFL